MLDPGELDQLIAAAGRAGLLAKGAADIGVATQFQRQVELETELLVTVLGRTVDALDLPYEFRVWVKEVVHRQLQSFGDDAPAPGLPPPPGKLAVVREVDETEPQAGDAERPAKDG